MFEKLSDNELAYILAFVPLSPCMSLVCRYFDKVLNTNVYYKLWKAKYFVEFLHCEALWIGPIEELNEAREKAKGKLFDTEEIQSFVKIKPYSGIVCDSYEQKYFDDINIYEKGILKRKYYDTDHVVFYDVEYTKDYVSNIFPKKYTCENEDYIIYPIYKRHYDIKHCVNTKELVYDLKDKFRIRWHKYDIEYNEIQDEYKENLIKPLEYTIIINNGKKMYKVIGDEYFRVKRKKVGNKIKKIKEDGTIVYRSRMQEIKEYYTPISKDKVMNEIGIIIPDLLFDKSDVTIFNLNHLTRSEITNLTLGDYDLFNNF